MNQQHPAQAALTVHPRGEAKNPLADGLQTPAMAVGALQPNSEPRAAGLASGKQRVGRMHQGRAATLVLKHRFHRLGAQQSHPMPCTALEQQVQDRAIVVGARLGSARDAGVGGASEAGGSESEWLSEALTEELRPALAADDL